MKPFQLRQIISLLIIIVSSGHIFAQAPVITGFTPTSSAVGTQITINGSNFNATASMNVVTFGGGRANVLYGSTTYLTVNVPYCTTYEQISVINLANHLTGYSTLPFRRIVSSPRGSIQLADLDTKVDIATGAKPNKVLISDLDGDGKSDIIVANATGSTITVFHNEASYGTIASTMFANKIDLPTNGNPTAMEIMDINGDGAPDIVVANALDNSVSVYRNTSTSGHPSFASKVDMATGNYPFALSIGDIDLDGRPDLAVANLKDSTVSVFQNLTTTSGIAFAARHDFYSGWAPNAIRMGDLDGDGKIEMIVANIKEKKLSVFKNISTIGTLGFNAKFNFDTGNQPSSVTLADVDLDGKLDVVVANYGTADHSVSVFRNTSTAAGITAGTFAARQDFSVGDEPTSVSIGDIDADGKVDVAVTNFNSNTISVLRNTSSSGSVSFSPKVDFATGFAPESVFIGDVDGDGMVDMLGTNNFQNTISIFRYYVPNSGHPAFPESTASASVGSFVNVDLMEAEWKNEVPSVDSVNHPELQSYKKVNDDGTWINADWGAPVNAGRFAYFYALGARTNPLVRVDGNLTFTAQGNGSIEVRIIATFDGTVQASHVFNITGDSQFHDYSWDFVGLYPQLEYYVGVIFNNGSAQGRVMFKKNFALNLRQAGLAGNFTRFRADASSLIGNSEAADGTNWRGWSDSFHAARRKYVQHSAYARMKFQTDATHMVIEYVREFYDKPLINLFPVIQDLLQSDFNTSTGAVISGYNAVDTAIRVTPGKYYTISGLHTNNPTFVFYKSTPSGLVPLGAPVSLNTSTNYGTAADPVYRVLAPANATNLGLLIMRLVNTTNYNDPANDNYYSFAYCMVQEGSPGDVTPNGPVPATSYQAYSGNVASRISGLTVYVNGHLYKYYQLDGIDIQKQVQYVIDDLPPGMKEVEVVAPGQGALTDFDPLFKRSGTFLRAVYFPAANTTVRPSTTQASGSIVYIHDSILSGYNISVNAQNNVWMMKTVRDPSYGFTGDVFSEGYAGRILHTDTKTDAGIDRLAAKLISFGVNKFWFQIGVNDFGFKTPLYNFYTEYKKLIEKMKTLRSDIKIWIQSTGPEFYEANNDETIADDGVTSTGPVVNDFRDVQRALATSHSYTEFVNFENLFSRTDPNLLSDGIHPTDAGNLLYANGIRDKSTLLGQFVTTETFGFNRTGIPIRTFQKYIPGVSIIRVKGGRAPYTYALTSGSIPAGLTFNYDGTISGTPTVFGNFAITVQVQDADGQTISGPYTIAIADVPTIVVAPGRLAGAQLNVPYTQKFSGSGGAGPYSVAFTPSGNMTAAGFTFNTTTGVLSGTPNTTTGSPFSFVITSTDHYGRSASRTYSLPVTTGAPAPLTDQITLDYSFDQPTGKVYVIAKINNTYSSKLTLSSGLGVYQGSSGQYFGTDSVDPNWGIEAQHLTSVPLLVGQMQPNVPLTLVNYYPGSVFPGTMDGVTITTAPNSSVVPPAH